MNFIKKAKHIIKKVKNAVTPASGRRARIAKRKALIKQQVLQKWKDQQEAILYTGTDAQMRQEIRNVKDGKSQFWVHNYSTKFRLWNSDITPVGMDRFLYIMCRTLLREAHVDDHFKRSIKIAEMCLSEGAKLDGGFIPDLMAEFDYNLDGRNEKETRGSKLSLLQRFVKAPQTTMTPIELTRSLRTVCNFRDQDFQTVLLAKDLILRSVKDGTFDQMFNELGLPSHKERVCKYIQQCEKLFPEIHNELAKTEPTISHYLIEAKKEQEKVERANRRDLRYLQRKESGQESVVRLFAQVHEHNPAQAHALVHRLKPAAEQDAQKTQPGYWQICFKAPNAKTKQKWLKKLARWQKREDARQSRQHQ